MKQIFFIAALLVASLTSCTSSKLATVTVSLLNTQDLLTEWVDGNQWVYQGDENYFVGITISPAKDNYGEYYQINTLFTNLSENPIVFDPNVITAQFVTNESILDMNVYTNEEFQKMIGKKQKTEMILSSIAEGLSAASAGYSTTYVNGYAYQTYNYGNAAAANMAASARLRDLGDRHEYDKNIKQVGYLKKNTIYPTETLSGYMNIKKDGGDDGVLVVKYNMGTNTLPFYWSVGQGIQEPKEDTNFIPYGQLLEHDNIFKKEFKNGQQWAYIEYDDYIVGATLSVSKNDPRTYKLDLSFENLSNDPIIFDPSKILPYIGTGTQRTNLKVYHDPIGQIRKQLSNTSVDSNNLLGVTTLYKGEKTSGYVLIKKSKWPSKGIFVVAVPINNETTLFQWEMK